MEDEAAVGVTDDSHSRCWVGSNSKGELEEGPVDESNKEGLIGTDILTNSDGRKVSLLLL
jgi:hypothetical protein